MYKILFFMPFAVFVLLAGCKEDTPSGVERTDEIIEVRTASPAMGADSYFSTSGRLQSSKKTHLSTRTMGFISSVNVDEGDRISRGTVAISVQSGELDARREQAEARIESAAANFREAERNYQRFQRLFESQSATERELEQAETAYNATKSGLESARAAKEEIMAQYAYTQIKAPFSGRVSRKFVEEGDIANPGMPLLEIESDNGLEVLTVVPESRIGQIELNSAVEVELTSTGERVTGRVSQITPSSGDRTAQFEVKVVPKEDFSSQFSGMFARVYFPEEDSVPRVMVPVSQLVRRGDLYGIYTVSQQNTAVLRWLRLGKTSGDYVEVLSGLSKGDRYITEAGSKLFNGARLEVQP